ncbi:hypothetical protein C8T65DRAFT_694056 [Cerioporus squamosus]|nr:hypothetical protein C8T65DRAFT_694056 [Cerioporus squamosus]
MRKRKPSEYPRDSRTRRTHTPGANDPHPPKPAGLRVGGFLRVRVRVRSETPAGTPVLHPRANSCGPIHFENDGGDGTVGKEKSASAVTEVQISTEVHGEMDECRAVENGCHESRYTKGARANLPLPRTMPHPYSRFSYRPTRASACTLARLLLPGLTFVMVSCVILCKKVGTQRRQSRVAECDQNSGVPDSDLRQMVRGKQTQPEQQEGESGKRNRQDDKQGDCGLLAGLNELLSHRPSQPSVDPGSSIPHGRLTLSGLAARLLPLKATWPFRYDLHKTTDAMSPSWLRRQRIQQSGIDGRVILTQQIEAGVQQ